MTSFLSRLTIALPLALTFAAAPAFSQEAAPSKFWRTMDHVDLGIQGMYFSANTVSGPVVAQGAFNYGTNLTESSSRTVGALGTIRYTPKPYVGFEFNYGEARYSIGFNTAPFTVQTQYNEFTLGYVATPPHPILGLQPYVGGGAGTIYFKPTRGGGNEEPKQPRAVYYYNLGVQKDVYGEHFGLRAGFREAFYLAPDFLTNYETILKRTRSAEPYGGFYLRF